MDEELPPPAEQSLLDPRVQDNPFPFYAHLHATCPVHHLKPSGGFPGAYLIGGYDDLKAALQDTDTFSARIGSRRKAMQGNAPDVFGEHLAEIGWPQVPTLQRCDGAEHARHRGLVDRIFTPKRVNELTPRIEAVVGMLIDRFIDRGECDYAGEFGQMIPAIIVCEQLGLDIDEIDRFRHWVEGMLAPGVKLLDAEGQRAAAEIEADCQHYLVKVFEDRRANPQSDMITHLVSANAEGEPLSTGELLNIMHQLIIGGLETTAAAIGKGLLLLLQHPDQMEKLRADRSLMTGFINEVLRFDSPVQALPRKAAHDATVHGVTIPAESFVQMRYGIANRDPAKFPEPDRFDITRGNAGEHIAFGYGSHFCVGAHLARREMQIAFNATLDRMADIKLARPLPSPAHHPNLLLRPLKELPISFRKV